MSHRLNYLLMLFAVFLCCACNENEMQKSLEEIKLLGDHDATLALSKIDSLADKMNGATDYTKMKYRLLKIRLKDKAYIPAESDEEVKAVCRYFEDNGMKTDLQEAYYYAGSVYRDLNDIPRSLEFFLKAENEALSNKTCDSLLLRNTYSNMVLLFFGVQDYPKALEMAKHEYKISNDINKVSINSLSHLADSYLRLDSIAAAYRISCVEEEYADEHSPVDMYALLYN